MNPIPSIRFLRSGLSSGKTVGSLSFVCSFVRSFVRRRTLAGAQPGIPILNPAAANVAILATVTEVAACVRAKRCLVRKQLRTTRGTTGPMWQARRQWFSHRSGGNRESSVLRTRKRSP